MKVYEMLTDKRKSFFNAFGGVLLEPGVDSVTCCSSNTFSCRLDKKYFIYFSYPPIPTIPSRLSQFKVGG